VRAMAVQESNGGEGSLLDDEAFRRKTAQLEIDMMTADWTDLHLSSGAGVGESVGGTAASIKKLLASTRSQDIAELAMEVLGEYAAPDQRRALGAYPQEGPIGPAYAITPTARHINNRASTVYGGSSEVQHNILARLLGL